MRNLDLTRFMGLDFLNIPRRQILAFIMSDIDSKPYRFLVTPNVDHVVNYKGRGFNTVIYDGAAYKICDSRILRILANLKRKKLVLYPGSDLVRDLLESSLSDDIQIAVVGPSISAFEQLRFKFPNKRFIFLPAPLGLIAGTAEWNALVKDVSGVPWQILLACISFPKQERLAYDLGAIGRQRGLTLCVGASVDFLTGAQKRAPYIMQLFALEWLYRLLKNPSRLWRRYLLSGPVIFLLFLRHEVLQRR